MMASLRGSEWGRSCCHHRRRRQGLHRDGCRAHKRQNKLHRCSRKSVDIYQAICKIDKTFLSSR